MPNERVFVKDSISVDIIGAIQIFFYVYTYIYFRTVVKNHMTKDKAKLECWHSRYAITQVTVIINRCLRCIEAVPRDIRLRALGRPSDCKFCSCHGWLDWEQLRQEAKLSLG